jgi:cytochrome P450 family 135
MWEWIARPIQFLERCSHRYGDVFTVHFSIGTVVFMADPALIKQVFTGDPDTFHAGEANATPLEPLMGRNSVLLLDGREHMRQRKLMLPSFHGERMQRYGDVMQAVTEREIARWPVGEPFGLRPRTQAITMEIIIRTVFGVDDAERLERLGRRLSAMLDIGGDPRALAAIAVPKVRQTVGRRVWKRFLRLREAADTEIYDVIARRRQAGDVEERDDVLSILLQARDEDGRALTDEELRDELMTLLVAGHETTATSLAWAFELLLRHRPQLARLQAEVDSGNGDEYLDAVIKETLRIRPVVPGVIRKLTAPIQLAGYEIPAGMRVAPNIYLTHRRPDVYPDPEQFRPERFIEQPADTYSWIPFGGGVRRCLGAAFATYEMKVVIPTILRNLQLRASDAAPERIRRRAVTFVPEHDGTVIVEQRRRPHTAQDLAAAVPA